ncbi:MAG: primosomal protein N' [Candidatus Marinimicrobia bacterium]|nr:primosomal protein N' [Candidatus Neomarinimicrobiota bacterium]
MNSPKIQTIGVVFPLLLDEIYSYKVPSEWNEIELGCRVTLPLRNKTEVGFVIENLTGSGGYSGRMKQAISLIDSTSPFSSKMLKFLKWMSEYYLSPHGLVMKAALPAGMGVKKTKKVRLINSDALKGKRLSEVMELIYKKLLRKESYSYSHLKNFIGPEGFDSAMEALLKAGAIKVEISYSGYDALSQDRTGKSDFQMEEILLTKAQAEVYSPIHKSLNGSRPKAFLLHGVTGSGKTEIYLRAARETLANKGDVLILVPEIALTPQIAERFGQFFGDNVSIFHSNQSESARRKAWEAIKRGESNVVVGTRSSIFAPLKNLKLLIVDEEQEPSYKQAEPDPRYNARDAAVMRAKFEGATLLLGSATPSLESMYNAKKGKYTYLRLTERYGKAATPTLYLINSESEKIKGGFSSVVISSLLKTKIAERLSRGEQIVLLQNRRGYSPLIRCTECGHAEECPDCNVTFTYHAATNAMNCHYCGRRTAVPIKCPKCGNRNLLFQGIGTQRVEKELSDLFPKVRVQRMDMDTTNKKNSHWKILNDFKKGKFDILLGTQMIAKGLDFENVTLVGIISADTGLYLPDFRASERTFQLISQVAGRAGRRKISGEVVVQSFAPENLPIQGVGEEEQEKFYRKIMKERKLQSYPPIGKLIVFETSSESRELAESSAKIIHSTLKRLSNGTKLFGPAPAVIEKLRKRYRWRVMILLSGMGNKKFREIKLTLRSMTKEIRKKMRKDLRLSVDVDPVNML